MSSHGGKRVGAGRKPKLTDRVKMAFWVDRPVLEKAKQEAERRGVTISEIVRTALQDLAAGDRRPRPRRSKTGRS